ncbi:MAG: HD domain-containing protein [Methanoregula sp.]|nr:HD domain-containing protein [Methanoregula sp.]
MTPDYHKAVEIAAEAASQAHRGQFRKNGKTPFIVHPKRVAELVKFYGGDHIGVIAAWLHDVIEDCDDGETIVHATLRQTNLPQHEQDDIFAIISALTKNPDIHGKSERLADILKRINQAPSQAILLKLCDRMDNLIDVRDRGRKFLSAYLSLTDQIIDALSEGAMNHGYVRALETLQALRKTYGE